METKDFGSALMDLTLANLPKTPQEAIDMAGKLFITGIITSELADDLSVDCSHMTGEQAEKLANGLIWLVSTKAETNRPAFTYFCEVLEKLILRRLNTTKGIDHAEITIDLAKLTASIAANSILVTVKKKNGSSDEPAPSVVDSLAIALSGEFIGTMLDYAIEAQKRANLPGKAAAGTK